VLVLVAVEGRFTARGGILLLEMLFLGFGFCNENLKNWKLEIA
jgi:hypothetical protein